MKRRLVPSLLVSTTGRGMVFMFTFGCRSTSLDRRSAINDIVSLTLASILGGEG